MPLQALFGTPTRRGCPSRAQRTALRKRAVFWSGGRPARAAASQGALAMPSHLNLEVGGGYTYYGYTYYGYTYYGYTYYGYTYYG